MGGANALPKPFSQIVGHDPRIILSSDDRSGGGSEFDLHLSGPTLMVRSTALRKKNESGDNNNNNVLRNTAQDVVSFAKKHPDLFLYAAVASASAYIIKSKYIVCSYTFMLLRCLSSDKIWCMHR